MKIKFKPCPRCRRPMCELDNTSYCLHCGYNEEEKEPYKPQFRRYVIDGNKEIADLCKINLANNLDASLTYCLKRGMTTSSINKWELGYVPDGFGRFREKDMWSRRLLFVVRSTDGKAIIGFGGRIITSEDRPKYVNSVASQEYEKRKNLYGSWFVPEHTDIIYLCEGYMDVITMDQHGYAYPVASLGTSLTTEQSEWIRQHTNKVVICFDSDEPGQIATTRAIELLKNAGFEYEEIKILKITGAKDIDECLAKGGGRPKEISVGQYFTEKSMWKELSTIMMEGGSAL